MESLELIQSWTFAVDRGSKLAMSPFSSISYFSAAVPDGMRGAGNFEGNDWQGCQPASLPYWDKCPQNCSSLSEYFCEILWDPLAGNSANVSFIWVLLCFLVPIGHLVALLFSLILYQKWAGPELSLTFRNFLARIRLQPCVLLTPKNPWQAPWEIPL